MKKNNNFTKLDEYKKKTHFNEKLGLDDRDNVILGMLQKNPAVSQDEIAKRIKLSQPSVGARIRKLQEKGVLHNISGVNFKTVNLHLAKIDVKSTDTKAIIDDFKHCPFFVNALVTSGKYNLCMFFTATSLKRLEGIVNHHLRGNERVKDMEVNIVVTTSRDFVLPMNMAYEEKMCNQDCMGSID
ncbi:Lrp/AsnC family transcriptional regulator [Candidatus Woesearchaeota archaeon]|nr:Lrp/AsnC family transcriptional regulator [Candidatus Woesearchaeota archaeon]